MRKAIPARDPDLPGYVIESAEAGEVAFLEADVVRHAIDPAVARRIGRAPLQAASLAEFKFRSTDGGGSAPDDDLPDLR